MSVFIQNWKNYLWLGMTMFLVVVMLFTIFDFFKIRGSQENRVTQLYFVDNISAAHQILIDRFNLEYKDKIEVVPVNIPFQEFSTNERKQLLTKSLRSKSDRIDIFTVDIIWVQRFARWAYPLDKYFSPEWQEQLLDIARESCMSDNKLVSIPFYTDIGMMYFRKDLIRAFPNHKTLINKLEKSITWQELIALHQSHPNLVNPLYMFPGKNFEGLMCSFMENVLMHNALFISEDSVQLNTPAAKKALQLMVDLVHNYQMTPVTVTGMDDYQVYRNAIRNNALFFRGWPGLRKNLRQFESLEKLENIGDAALPHFAGTPPVSILGGWNFMVSRFSTKKAAAVEFIKFALKKENQELIFEERGFTPVIKTVYEDPEFLKKNPELAYYKSLYARGIHRPYLQNYTKMSDIITYYLNLAIEKKISVSEALESATRKINSKHSIVF